MRKFKVLVAILSLIVVVELVLRLFGFGNPVLYVEDPDIGYLPKANQSIYRFGNKIYYNEYHQRSDDLMADPDYRVFMLGDSVLNGGTLIDQKDTISEILERQLNSFCNCKGEVLSASAKGWAIENEYEYLRKFGTFNSSLIIWVINEGDLYQKKNLGRDYPSKPYLFALSKVFFHYLRPRKSASGSQNPPLSFLSLLKTDSQVVIVQIPKRRSTSGKLDIQLERIDIRLSDNAYRDDIHLNRQGNYIASEIIFSTIKDKILD